MALLLITDCYDVLSVTYDAVKVLITCNISVVFHLLTALCVEFPIPSLQGHMPFVPYAILLQLNMFTFLSMLNFIFFSIFAFFNFCFNWKNRWYCALLLCRQNVNFSMLCKRQYRLPSRVCVWNRRLVSIASDSQARTSGSFAALTLVFV